jgi:predicted aspartyl protease
MFLLIIALVGSLLAPALAQDVVVPNVEEPPPAEIKPEDFVYVASTRADRIGRVMAPVYVNGVGPFAFVVDTGASSSVISPRVLARLQLVPDPARSILLRGITGSEVVPTVAVDHIAAGEVALRQNQLPVVEPRIFANADGIFGADAFARGCLYVNFDQATVAILRTGCPRVGSSWETMRAELRFGGLPVVQARVGRQTVLGIIDTGAERSLGNRALLQAAGLEPAIEDPKTQRQIYAATSQAVFGHIVPVPDVRLGDIRVDHLKVVFGEFEVFRMWDTETKPALVFGMDVLGTTQALMIDYKRKELRVLPPGEVNTIEIRPGKTPSRLP